jgi:hypothetical protein
MNPQSPTRPLHVPTLTEVIDTPQGMGLASTTQAVQATLDEQSLSQWPPAEEPVDTEVPRNLMRGTLPPADSAAMPPPMSAGVAMPQPAPNPSPQALQAARDSLSGALRSARDGRWAPMSNVELPGMNELLDDPQPVLPEVAEVSEVPEASTLPLPLPPVAPAMVMSGEVTEVTEAQLAHRVLGVVQKQIDGMLDFRLREAMTPILQRHTDALVRELRDELKQTMQDVITRAVAQEMAKVRQR